MFRLLLFVVGLAVLALVLMRLVREARSLKIDWTGVTFAIAFVVMAFYLRSVTGLG